MDQQEKPTMNQIEKQLMSYLELRERQKSNVLIRSEVPVEHAISLPLPTNRWGEPSYAYFAAAALRRPQEPMRQSAPDRWWIIAAYGGRMMVYALTKSIPFPSNAVFEAVTLPRVAMSRDELRQSLKTMEEKLEVLTPRFFAGEPGDAIERGSLASMLAELIPEPLQPQYRAMVPDFFEWLEK